MDSIIHLSNSILRYEFPERNYMSCSSLIFREKGKVAHMCPGMVANLTAKQQEIKAKLRQFMIKTRELKKKNRKKYHCGRRMFCGLFG